MKTDRQSGSVRIIGGDWRRTRLALAPGSAVRPTPDRVRETLFNWIGRDVLGADCLDLFAGTGVLGLEALSRGARSATLVERDNALAARLGEHARRLGASARVVVADAATFVAAVPDQAFDIVFLDPPFDRQIEPLLESLERRLRPGGQVYVERAASSGLPAIEGWHWRRQSRAGNVCFGLATHDADV